MKIAIRTVRLTTIFAIVASIVLTLSTALPASAGPRLAFIANGHGFKCLDADLGSPIHNGTRVQIWNCKGMDNQQWFWDGSMIRNAKDPGKCLDADASAPLHDGTRVQLWDCLNNPNQWWSGVLATGQIKLGWWDSNRCLDQDISSPPHNGTVVQIWGCNGWDNQVWNFYW
jgi:hypothetical protein